jgi:hypothetical protein
MRRITIIAVLAAIAVLATAAVANATVTVNPDGSGFVGKGDVQSLLGYNNKQMQNAVEAKGFDWSQKLEFSTTWESTDSTGTHVVTRHQTGTRLMAAAEARNNSNGKDGPLTGWYLTGKTAYTWETTFDGADRNGDGVVTAMDAFFTTDAALPVLPDRDGNGIPDAPVQQITFTNSVNGVGLPGVTLPAGVVPAEAITPVV